MGIEEERKVAIVAYKLKGGVGASWQGSEMNDIVNDLPLSEAGLS